MDNSTNVLEIEGLKTYIRLTRTTVRAVDGISMHIAPGETLGLVGESGCGKSITGMSIMKLLPSGGNIVDGSIKLSGRDLVPLEEKAMRDIRGNEVAVIFQDPMTSLNPTMTIGDQIGEVLHIHRDLNDDETRERCAEVLGLVGMPRPKERLNDYPHQLSGGLRQRVMIAMALVCDPKLLIADEPTTALDVTIQAQILDLLDDLRRRLHMAVLLITHDMGVIAGRADRVAVMYAGKIVETGRDANAVQGHAPSLHGSACRGDPSARPGRRHRPVQHPRSAAGPHRAAARVPFRGAMQIRHAVCHTEEPVLIEHEPDHLYACHHPAGVDSPLVPETVPAR